MRPDSFRFLDLPKELRLMVYDLLITRHHHKLTWHKGGESASITLVTPDPIPPVHLTCKSLRDEAGSFLRGKVLRMTVPREVPRLIVHAGPPGPLFSLVGLLDDILYCFGERRVNEKDFSAYFFKNMENDLRYSTDELNVIISYIKSANGFFGRVGTAWVSWFEEAENMLRRDGTISDFDALDASVQELEVQSLGQELMSAPSARLREVRLLLVKDDNRNVGPGTQELMQCMAELCGRTSVRAFVHTFGLQDAGISFTDTDGWICYDGVMNEKTWAEEWS